MGSRPVRSSFELYVRIGKEALFRESKTNMSVFRMESSFPALHRRDLCLLSQFSHSGVLSVAYSRWSQLFMVAHSDVTATLEAPGQ